MQGSDHCPVSATLGLALLAAPRPPPTCTRFYKEFAGKQQTLMRFVAKRSRADDASVTLLAFIHLLFTVDSLSHDFIDIGNTVYI